MSVSNIFKNYLIQNMTRIIISITIQTNVIYLNKDTLRNINFLACIKCFGK